MLVDLGIILIGYLGIRLYKGYQGRPLLTQDLGKEHQKLLEGPVEQQRSYHRYLTVSMITTGVAMVRSFYPPLALINLGLLTYAIFPVLREMENSLFVKGKVDGYVVYGGLELVTVGFGRYFLASLGTLLFNSTRVLANDVQEQSRKILSHVFVEQQLPTHVWVLQENKVEVEIPFEELAIHDVVVIKAGEIVPVNGTVVEGQAVVNQYFLTGEGNTLEKVKGDKVFASTVIVNGGLYLDYQGK